MTWLILNQIGCEKGVLSRLEESVQIPSSVAQHQSCLAYMPRHVSSTHHGGLELPGRQAVKQTNRFYFKSDRAFVLLKDHMDAIYPDSERRVSTDIFNIPVQMCSNL